MTQLTEFAEKVRAEVRKLGTWTPEQWDEHRGGDPIARTVNAVEDILDAALAAVPAHTPGALDVGRVKRAIQAVAKRHRIVRDPIPPQSLMSIFGYSAAPADMDAEIAAAYEAASPSEETR